MFLATWLCCSQVRHGNLMADKTTKVADTLPVRHCRRRIIFKFRQDNSLASLNSREGPVSIKRRRILLHMFKSLFDWCGVSYERVLEMQRTTFLLDLQMLLERDQLRARVR